jgi:Phosphate-selective porin O and P
MKPFPCAAAGAAFLLTFSTAHAEEPEPAARSTAAPAAPATDEAAEQEDEAAEQEEEPAPKRAAAPSAAAAGAPAAGAPAAGAPATGAGDPLAPGFRAQLHADLGPLSLAPITLLQVQAAPYVGEDSLNQAGDIAERPGFRLRRARFGVQGDLDDRVRFAFSADIGDRDNGELLFNAAWAGYTGVPAAQIFAGARAVPFSRSAMGATGGAADTALIDRPLAVRAFAPFTQVGLHAEGHFLNEAFSYYAGVYNGFQRSEQFYAGQSESYAPRGNRFEGLAFAGRVATEPLGPLGSRAIQDLERSPFRFGAGADYFFSNGGARALHGASADVLLHISGLHVLSEVLWTRSIPSSVPTQPITQVTSISSLAVVGEAGYMIITRRLGVTARVEWIDPDLDAKDESDNLLITAGTSYHVFDDLLKAQLEFTHREELAGLSLANDTLTLQLQLSL